MDKIISSKVGIALILIIYGPIIIYLIFLSVSYLRSEVYFQNRNENSNQIKEVFLQEVPEDIKVPEDILGEIKNKGKIVYITEDGFLPREIAISEGESVSFINYDSEVHKIEGGTFDTREIEPGNIWTFPCHEKGIFEYNLKDNPAKTGKVIVK